MKKRTFAILFTFLVVSSCVFASCNANQKIFEGDNDNSNPESTCENMINELENKIIELQQNQYISKSEQAEEIKQLQALLAELKKGSESDNDSSADNDNENNKDNTQNNNSNEPKFLYTLEEDNIIITGYTGNDEHIVIPSKIDGHSVIAISDNAFNSKNLKSVIINNGISKIGWFAFSDCAALSSITIPSSVTSIGYSAFSSEPNAITIYCPNDSFAQKYAQSYGLSYAVI